MADSFLRQCYKCKFKIYRVINAFCVTYHFQYRGKTIAPIMAPIPIHFHTGMGSIAASTTTQSSRMKRGTPGVTSLFLGDLTMAQIVAIWRRMRLGLKGMSSAKLVRMKITLNAASHVLTFKRVQFQKNLFNAVVVKMFANIFSFKVQSKSCKTD